MSDTYSLGYILEVVKRGRIYLFVLLVIHYLLVDSFKMSEKSEKWPLKILTAKCDVFKWPVLSDQQAKTQSIHLQ